MVNCKNRKINGFRKIILGGRLKKVNLWTLENELVIANQPAEGNHLGGVCIQTGSMGDPIRKIGSSYVHNRMGACHVSEHWMSRGANRDEDRHIMRLFKAYNTNPPGEITRTYSYFGTGLVARRTILENSMSLIAHMLNKVRDSKYRIDSSEVETEKAAIIAEIGEKYDDDMNEFIDRVIIDNLYEHNPITKRREGTVEGVRSITSEDIRNFIETYYVPNNMHIFDCRPKDQAIRWAEKAFGAWKKVALPEKKERIITRPDLASRQCLERVNPKSNLFHVAIAFPTEPFVVPDKQGKLAFNPENVGLDVLDEVLELRMWYLLRDSNVDIDKGIYYPMVDYSRTRHHGLVYMKFSTPSEESAKRGIDKILKDLTFIRSGRIDLPNLEQIAKFKSKELHELKKDFMMGVDACRHQYHEMMESDPTGLTDVINEHLSNGDDYLEGLHNYKHILNQYGYRRLVGLANKYFDPDKCLVLTVRPEKPMVFSDQRQLELF